MSKVLDSLENKGPLGSRVLRSVWGQLVSHAYHNTRA